MKATAFSLIPNLASWVIVVVLWLGTSKHGIAVEQTLGPSLSEEHLSFFESQVRPLLVTHCYECHSTGAKKLQAGLVLDSRAGMIRGGDSGSAVVPNNSAESLLIQSVRYESFEMPPKGKLSASEISTLERWIDLGAPWPSESMPIEDQRNDYFDLPKRKANHWAWKSIQSPQTPSVADISWPRDEIDFFILSQLEHKKLKPSPDAESTALLRRVYFDLIGLPPSPDEVLGFIKDDRPNALEEVVDKLLDSEHFGERWARHWLDLVRYAESRGHEFDHDASNAFQYRDYVIRAFNADVSYDQLVREHIAGDLLTNPRLNSQTGFNESILGTGFWFLGEWVHSPVDIRKDETDRFDNMIDVMSKTFLGVTVSCARCHDHKFDAISTADYYALSGFLQSSDFRQVRFDSIDSDRKIATELQQTDDHFCSQLEEALGFQNEIISEEHFEAKVDLLPKDVDISNSFSIAVDYSSLDPASYMQDGFTFGKRPRKVGELFLERVSNESTSESTTKIRVASRTAAASDPFWNRTISRSEKNIEQAGALSKFHRSGRTLRTPSFILSSGQVDCHVRGKGLVFACVDSHRLVAGPLHNETVKIIDEKEAWTKLNLERYVGHRIHLEFTPDTDSYLEVSHVVQGAMPSDRQRIQDVDALVQQEIILREKALDELLAQETEQSRNVKRLMKAWSDRRQSLQSQLQKESRLAMAMCDGASEDDHVLIRGNSSNPGKLVPRHFLTAIAGDQPMKIASGSGRLELANQINDPSNPLASRVIVNRIWHHLMGRGIVATTDDFGVLGQLPTHPELLDYLAIQFRQNGNSIKSLIRRIVLSRTYQMASNSQRDALDADPKNLLWHHRPPKRLEGEAIRDALLTISARLNRNMFGPSVPIHLTSFMDGRGRPSQSGPVDGDGRRSIYIAVRRNFLSPFMMTFDTPTPFSTMGKRNVSNVPAQALILMNDPLVKDLTSLWAERVLETIPGDASEEIVRARLNWLYLSAFARLPNDREIQAAIVFLYSDTIDRKISPNDSQKWGQLTHALVNTKEFIFLR